MRESSPVMDSRVASCRPAFWKSKNIVPDIKFGPQIWNSHPNRFVQLYKTLKFYFLQWCRLFSVIFFSKILVLQTDVRSAIFCHFGTFVFFSIFWHFGTWPKNASAHLISVSNGLKWKPVMYSYSGEVEPLNWISCHYKPWLTTTDSFLSTTDYWFNSIKSRFSINCEFSKSFLKVFIYMQK